MSTTKRAVFVVLALLAAAVFVRLGFWQLHRRKERLALNALVRARYDAPPVDVSALPADTAKSRFMRARVSGTLDYAHELTYAARSYKGSPGVNLFTPVRIPGSDTAVLVDRGWIYAADGATIDREKWRDRDSSFVGYVDELPPGEGSTYTNRPTVIAHLAYGSVSKTLPYPVKPYYVVATSDSENAADRIARLSIPPLDEGPHLNYAIQWFMFATIAVVGAGIVIIRRNDG